MRDPARAGDRPARRRAPPAQAGDGDDLTWTRAVRGDPPGGFRQPAAAVGGVLAAQPATLTTVAEEKRSAALSARTDAILAGD
jgi:hypothetical protein